ncbi:40S ribosomal protein S10, mitochondrial isoform X2 [Raphanus sativus]|uniref:40S ribosomal protein S10, mitochondrial isoform X2 n=1 Tax=Raphanus sativus TaxID=3726 RepID=A0A6J0LYM2_RAPSA|nr:40S ribosomal protein S10, mitochondrial isoform X2 [Raphanus sativus]
MITGMFRRSSLPSRQTLSAALSSFDSALSRNFTTGASAKLNPIGNGSNLSSASFQGYATERETSVADSIKITPENVKPLSKKKEGEESTSKIKGTRICIAIRSFDNPEKEAWCLPPHSRYAAMPDTRTLYTVLRSPHVDKKSREQFEMRFKKRFLVIKAQSHELNKKLFWLKRYRILGAQYELQFHCKTRLDMSPVLASINGSTIGGQ